MGERVVESVETFMAAVRSMVGERWQGPEQAPVADSVLDDLAAKRPLTAQHRAWLRAFGGKVQTERIPAENGTALDALSAKQVSDQHDKVLQALPGAGLPFANSGRDYLVLEGEQVVFRATDGEYRHVVAESISAFFDEWAARLMAGEAVFSRDDPNSDWSLWALSSLDARVKMRRLDDLTMFANFVAFSKLCEAGAPVFAALVKRGLIELTEPKAIPSAKSLFGLGLVTRARADDVRTELAEIALMWLEDDSVVDELFADAEAVVQALG